MEGSEQQKPDRNLALELVRVTEAAGARLRPLGRARRQDRRRPGRGRRDAVRPRLGLDGRHRRHRRGREGRGPDALQRREHRRRQLAGRRHRGRPARGHPPLRARHAQRARGDRPGRARDDVRSGALRLHGKDGRQPGDRRHPRPRSPAPRDPEADCRAQGRERRRRHRGDARSAAARGRDEGGPRGGWQDPPDHRRRRLGGAARGQRPLPGRPPLGDRRDAARACSRRRR